jgi:hypothetical protein
METIHMAVYASALLKGLSDSTYAGNRTAERWEGVPSHGLRDVARLVAALGAIAAYAGVLAIATH